MSIFLDQFIIGIPDSATHVRLDIHIRQMQLDPDATDILSPACESLRDLDQLYADMGMADEAPDDAIHTACNPELPDAGKSGAGLLRKAGSGGVSWWRLCRRFIP
jgi:hypothetical protein